MCIESDIRRVHIPICRPAIAIFTRKVKLPTIEVYNTRTHIIMPFLPSITPRYIYVVLFIFSLYVQVRASTCNLYII